METTQNLRANHSRVLAQQQSVKMQMETTQNLKDELTATKIH